MQYKDLLEEVETRAEQRLQRRLVILLAKQPKQVSKKKLPLIFKVLKETKVVKLICEYIS